MTDYRKFKTPFFEVYVGDLLGKNMVKLPPQIMRLIEKVEIIECLDSNTITTMSLTIIEGSREPARNHLYSLDSTIKNTLSNKSGIISDLKFGKNNSITFTNSLKEKVSYDANGTLVKTDLNPSVPNPTFVFQEKNHVKITWGYREDPSTIRSMQNMICIIETDFSDSVKTTIHCQPIAGQYDQVVPPNGGKAFRYMDVTQGNVVGIAEDQKLTDLFKDLSSKTGVDTIVSKDLPSDKYPTGAHKIWATGQSFHRFLAEMAKENNSFYETAINPINGKHTIIFIKKTDWEARTIAAGTNYLSYKEPGSLIKKVSIRCDFSAIVGNTQNSVTEQGKLVTSNPIPVEIFYPGEGRVNVDPYQIPACRDTIDFFLNSGKEVTNSSPYNIVGSSQMNPAPVGTLSQEALANSMQDLLDKRIINMDITTIGYTRFTPGVINVTNIGVRYSGRYRAMTVKHTLDNSGYTTQITANSLSIASGGVAPKVNAPKGQETKRDVTLFQHKDKPDAELMKIVDKLKFSR